MSEAKRHLKVEDAETADDDLITTLITVARQNAETVTRRALITQVWYFYLADWPEKDYIEIPLPPLQSVASVKYKDTEGAESVFAATDYIVDTKSTPGRIVLAYGKTWPSATLYPTNPITVEFTCGYGTSGTSVPAAIKQAMLVDIADLYQQRETVITGTTVSHLPTVDRLLAPYRVWTF